MPPVSVTIATGERNPTSGRPFSLPCHVLGSRPVPHITWWKNGNVLLAASNYNQVRNRESLSASTQLMHCCTSAFFCCFLFLQSVSINGSSAISTLTLTMNREDMGTRVTCRAINPSLDSSVMEDSWNVDLSCKLLNV